MVHGPKIGCMVDQVHRLFSLVRLTCTEFRAAPLNSPLFLCFFHGALTPVTYSPASFRSGASAQLSGEKRCQALATATVGLGRRLGLPRTLATVVGGLAVLADGEVARAGFLVSRLGG